MASGLFSWIGGKTHQLKTIERAVAPWMAGCEIWCEPFFGSGKVWGGLVSAGMTQRSLLKPAPTRLVAGDLAPEAVSALKTARDNSRQLVEALEKLDAERRAIPEGEGELEKEKAAGRVGWYNSLRDSFREDELTTPDLVAKWLTVRRFQTSFSLGSGKQAEAWFRALLRRKPSGLAERVAFWSNALAGSDFEQRTWQETLRRLPADCSRVVVYADPPYLAGKQVFYGECFPIEEHEELIDALKEVHERGAKIAYSNSLADSGPGSEAWYRQRFGEEAVIGRSHDFQSIDHGTKPPVKTVSSCSAENRR